MIRLVLVIAIFIAAQLTGSEGWAYRDYFTPEQKAQLAKVQMVRLEVIALTDKGKADPGPIAEVVTRRLQELGYEVVTDSTKPSDVEFKVKCEQRKTWEGTTPQGGDADLPDSPSRVWKGPACQLNYLLGGTRVKWQKEVRTDFEDAVQAAQKANAADPGDYALGDLKKRLGQYDFPVLLAAEWGHHERLVKLLDDPGTNELRKLKIISLLGEMLADEALPKLREALKDKGLAKQAAVALGNVGKESIPILIDMLKNSKDPELQAAAAKGLGQVGNINPDPRIIPTLLEMLDPPSGIDIRVQIEVAWALGRLPDKKAEAPLKALDRKLQKLRDPDDLMLKKLKEAVFWSIKQIDTYDMFS
ncbi:MAG: HEAT repeat domain-containing protein [Nitrospirota bacterium]